MNCTKVGSCGNCWSRRWRNEWCGRNNRRHCGGWTRHWTHRNRSRRGRYNTDFEKKQQNNINNEKRKQRGSFFYNKNEWSHKIYHKVTMKNGLLGTLDFVVFVALQMKRMNKIAFLKWFIRLKRKDREETHKVELDESVLMMLMLLEVEQHYSQWMVLL